MIDPSFLCVFLLILSLANTSNLKRDASEEKTCPSFCPFVWNPVCGSDDKTYDNACHLQAASCYKNKDLTLKYEGVCREIYPNEASCLVWRHCSPPTKPFKVCASNGNAYADECHMMLDSCRQNKTIYKIPCSKIDPKMKDNLLPPQSNQLVSAYLNILPSNSVRQRHPKLAEVSSDVKGSCLDDLTCSKLYLPVCGSDGNTYDNECILQGWSRCKRRNTLVKAFSGDCKISDRNISESCSNFDVSQCPDLQEYVCGEDGRSYKNECFMMGSSCNKGFLIAKRHDGPCGASSQRQKKQTFNTLKKCPFACNLIYKPVCASDGQTYANQCQFESKNCVSSGRLLVIVAEGPCSAPTFEFEPTISEEDPDLECPKFCTFEFMPVCGLDGITYSNMCQLRFEACQNDTNIELDHPGVCDDEFEAVVSEEEEENFGEDGPCPAFCSFNHDEVCGNDDRTYRNNCHLKYQSCLYPEDKIKKAYDGPCSSENKVKNAQDTCPRECPNDYNPICGSDGSTYVNKCRLRLKNCIFTDGPNIVISYYGSCLDDCPEYCPTKYEPICGSDKVTYVNECNLIATNCREKSRYIFLLDTGECTSERKSDIYEQRSIDIDAFQPSLAKGCDSKEICGSDGNTYSSFCDIIEANRGKKTKIYKVYEGRCHCPEVCPFDLQPVCGSDGITYPNLCAFQVKICSLQRERRPLRNIFVQMTGKNCEDHMNSKLTSSKSMERCMKDVPEFCSTNYDPVCGSDGKSYANVCQMKRQGCLSGQMDVEVYHFGLCYCTKRESHCAYSFDKPFCGVENNEYYENLCDLEFKICENIATTSSPSLFPLIESANESCVMPKEEELSYCELMTCESWPLSPVCASNGRSFANECYFKKYKCFQISILEDRWSTLSPNELEDLKDIKLVKREVCEEKPAFTPILQDDYYNDEDGSFLDERLNLYLKKLLRELKYKMRIDRLDIYHLIDIRQKVNELVTNVVLQVSDSEHIKCMITEDILENGSNTINEECFPVEKEEFNQTPSESNVTQSSCNGDGRIYYPNSAALESSFKKSSKSFVLDKSSERHCCPECGVSLEDEDEMVCGSDSISYISKCQLKRYICLQGSKDREIFFLHNGPCKAEKDIIANVSTRNPKVVDDDIRKVFNQHVAKTYPRWTIRGAQVDGPKTFVLILLEKLCFNQNRRSSTRKHCRSSLYGQRKMVCRMGVQEGRIVQEHCLILGIKADVSNIHKAATIAVELISNEFNDTNPWIPTSIGKTDIKSTEESDLMSIYLTMTRSETCEGATDPCEFPLDNSPVNFCDVQVEKTPSGFQLLSKICAGYKVEQFFRQSG